jgi:hypothetical protein
MVLCLSLQTLCNCFVFHSTKYSLKVLSAADGTVVRSLNTTSDVHFRQSDYLTLDENDVLISEWNSKTVQRVDVRSGVVVATYTTLT